MKITKEEFDRLYVDPHTITVREYNSIIDKVDDRFAEVVKTLLPTIQKKGWFDYGNVDYESENSHGHFDPKEYKEMIKVGGQYSQLPEPYECGNEFPTRWLWEENFKDEFDKAVEDYRIKDLKEKEQKKQKLDLLNERKKKFRKIIESKLTKEELRYISFR